MKKILCIIMAIFMAIGLWGCSTLLDDDDATSARYEIVGQTKMNVDYDSYLGYSVEITGKLKNTTNKEFSYVSVTFALYDADGNQIETALDNMNYLQAGATWSFKATVIGWTDVEPKSYKLVEVSAF